MKDLYQCKECGFLSTYYPGFIYVNGELLCEYCAIKTTGVISSTNLKSSNSEYMVASPQLKKLAENQKSLTPEMVQLINENFWELF